LRNGLRQANDDTDEEEETKGGPNDYRQRQSTQEKKSFNENKVENSKLLATPLQTGN
jgi:hypothetical protein